MQITAATLSTPSTPLVTKPEGQLLQSPCALELTFLTAIKFNTSRWKPEEDSKLDALLIAHPLPYDTAFCIKITAELGSGRKVSAVANRETHRRAVQLSKAKKGELGSSSLVDRVLKRRTIADAALQNSTSGSSALGSEGGPSLSTSLPSFRLSAAAQALSEAPAATTTSHSHLWSPEEDARLWITMPKYPPPRTDDDWDKIVSELRTIRSPVSISTSWTGILKMERGTSSRPDRLRGGH